MTVTEHAKRSRWMRWLTIAAGIATAQLVIQLINAVTGVLVVRSLDKTSYAWFTIVSTFSAVLSTIGDSGLSTGMLSTGGKVWTDRLKLSELITTGIALRRLLYASAAVGGGAWCFWMLVRNGSSAGGAVLLILVTILGGSYATLTVTVAYAPRLTGRYRLQQQLEVIVAGLRLLLTAGTLLTRPILAVLVMVNTAAQWTHALLIKRKVADIVDLAQPPSPALRSELMKSVRALWFPVLFNTIQALLGPFIITLYGSTASVADIGALTRFAAAFAVISAVVHHAVAPAFARSIGRSDLAGLALTGGGILSFGCGLLIATAWLFPAPFLWVIGPSYAHLGAELILYFILQSLSTISIYLWVLNSSRGWISLAWIVPLLTTLLQIPILAHFSVGSVETTLWFLIASQVPPLAINALLTINGFRTWQSQEAALADSSR